jgi:hypothetical protein
MEKDCAAMLKRMYGGDDGSTKQDIMECKDLLTNFFDVRRKVRKCLRLWTITSGICWIDNIKFGNKK